MILLDDDDEVIYRPRNYRPRINFNLPSTNFREAFRVDPPVIEEVERKIGRFLERPTERSFALSVREQILITCHFMGNGSYYHINGHVHGIDKGTVCRTIHKVCRLIARHLMPIYIRWPNNDRNLSGEFERRAGFPHVKGLIDGTLVHIDAPSMDEPVFVGRDNRHSMNVVVVSGPRHELFFVSARCGGSFHDSRCLQVSELWNTWELRNWRPNNDMQSVILGDSAYPLRKWLMTPNIRAINAQDPALADAIPIYLQEHRKTRFMVECAIGILKEQFPCLNHMRIRSPWRISMVIYASATMHNMQNNYRHGSYAYDRTLHRIANAIYDPNIHREHNQAQNNNNHNNEFDAIQRQREFLEYFTR